MGLKSLLIILVIFGGTDTHTALIFSVLIFLVSSIYIFGKKWLLRRDESFMISILIAAIIAVLLSILVSSQVPLWYDTNRRLLFLLPLVPAILLEYRELTKALIFKELRLFIEAFIVIAALKELISYGSLLGVTLISNYEGILYFDTYSGTLLFLAFALIIQERVGEKE